MADRGDHGRRIYLRRHGAEATARVIDERCPLPRRVVHLRAPLDRPGPVDGRLCRGIGGGGSATAADLSRTTCRSCRIRFVRETLLRASRARYSAQGWVQFAARWLRRHDRGPVRSPVPEPPPAASLKRGRSQSAEQRGRQSSAGGDSAAGAGRSTPSGRPARCGAAELISDPEWCADGPWTAVCTREAGHGGPHVDEVRDWTWGAVGGLKTLRVS